MENVKILLATDLERALEYAFEHTKGNPYFHHQMGALDVRFSNLKNDNHKGILSQEFFSTERNRISNDLLVLVREIEQKGLHYQPAKKVTSLPKNSPNVLLFVLMLLLAIMIVHIFLQQGKLVENDINSDTSTTSSILPDKNNKESDSTTIKNTIQTQNVKDEKPIYFPQKSIYFDIEGINIEALLSFIEKRGILVKNSLSKADLNLSFYFEEGIYLEDSINDLFNFRETTLKIKITTNNGNSGLTNTEIHLQEQWSQGGYQKKELLERVFKDISTQLQEPQNLEKITEIIKTNVHK